MYNIDKHNYLNNGVEKMKNEFKKIFISHSETDYSIVKIFIDTILVNK